MRQSPAITPRRSVLVAAAAALTALLLTLLLPSQMLLSSANTDLVNGFAASRAFAVHEIEAGRVPLWNPYIYGGQPFLGDFESAVLYPLNAVFFCLPLARALNFSILLHLVILGWGMERWATRRGMVPAAAALAGFMTPLSGVVFPHVFAGHLSNLCTMAWAPWIFLGFESWAMEGSRRGLLWASAGIAWQILAGHIQIFFYTAVAAGFQAIALTLANPAARGRALPAVVGCYLLALALAAAQLVPAFSAAADGIRQTNLDYGIAAMFSFPPENILTLIAPGFFGTLETPVYWGRCYLWEMSLFLGTVGPLLIGVALGDARGQRRGAAFDLAIAGCLLVLALGAHTFLFRLLYQDMPGFGRFRGWSKFDFPAALFLIQVIARGVHVLWSDRKIPAALAWGGAAVSGFVLIGGLALVCVPGLLSGAFRLVAASRESYLAADVFTQPVFIQQAGLHGGLSLLLAGTVLLAGSLILLFGRRWPWLLPALLAVEMVGFAGGQVATSHFSDAASPPLSQFIAAHPGDYRVLNLEQPDNGFLIGAGDLSGNNPAPLRRYTEFIFASQGQDPDHPSQYLPFRTLPPVYAMLRLRYAFTPVKTGFQVVQASTPPLPEVLLTSDVSVVPERNALFAAMLGSAFDPSETTFLESEPNPKPEFGAEGNVRLLASTPDELEIDATVDKPALLLVTNLYDHNWRAEAAADSVQKTYQLMPANYVLQAVPLSAGHHHLKILYSAKPLAIGLAISAMAWLAWIGGFVWADRRCKLSPA